MKRFLYKPVLNAIAARERHIADELADADQKKSEAQKDRDDFQQKNDVFDHDRAALLSKATADANAERQRLMDAARQAADTLTANHHETLVREAQSLNQALRIRMQQEVFAVARKTLADLATASLETSACDLFIQRLRALNGPVRDELAGALKAADNGALVRSAFELPQAQRGAVQKAVDETFSIAAALQFETAPNLVGGIELSAHGHKFAWSISDYLASLDRGVAELIKAPATAAPGPA